MTPAWRWYRWRAAVGLAREELQLVANSGNYYQGA
jgi:hypothetical protein